VAREKKGSRGNCHGTRELTLSGGGGGRCSGDILNGSMLSLQSRLSLSSDDPSPDARFLALRPSSIHHLGTNYDAGLVTCTIAELELRIPVWIKCYKEGNSECRAPTLSPSC